MLPPFKAASLWSFFICIASSSVLQRRALKSTSSNLNPLLSVSNITEFDTTSSLDRSWPAMLPASVLANLPKTYLNTNSSTEPAVNLTGVLSDYTALAKCDGDTYGYSLNKASCQEAWELLPKSKDDRICEFNSRPLIPQKDTSFGFQHVSGEFTIKIMPSIQDSV